MLQDSWQTNENRRKFEDIAVLEVYFAASIPVEVAYVGAYLIGVLAGNGAVAKVV